MGYTVWHFVVDEVKGDLKRVPAVRWSAEVVWAAHDPIRELELDASRFWIPIEAQLIRLAVLTDLPVDEIKAALVPRVA